MKINAENFFGDIDKLKLKNNLLLVSGNESSLIAKIEALIIKKISNKNFLEKNIVDIKKNKKPNFEELLNSKSLFSESGVVLIINANDSVVEDLNKINNLTKTIIVSGENIKNNSKIKKYFDLHEKFYSIACYKLTDLFKKKIIDGFINSGKCKLTKEAYWFLLENSSDIYQLLENELNKILNFNKENITLEEIKKLSGITKKIELEDLFFQCIVGNNKAILANSENALQTQTDAYSFLNIVKKFSKILINTSEKKNHQSVSSLVSVYLPKYLFKQKNNFETIIKKTDLNKVVKINNLIQKSELYLRKNDSNFLIIIQRFLLNCAQTLR